MKPRLGFQHFLCADYSGTGDNDWRNKHIVLWESTSKSDLGEKFGNPGKLLADMDPAVGQHPLYSRETLREKIERLLKGRERTLIAVDHQYSWPANLWALARFSQCTTWRDAIAALAEGANGMPPLERPRDYCSKFNVWACGNAMTEFGFWCAIRGIAARYGIPSSPPKTPDHSRYRLTEQHKPRFATTPEQLPMMNRGAAADCVGGRGPGVVGGQTICGLAQLAELAKRDDLDLAFWPFDGLDINGDNYSGKHICAEIYPRLLLHEDVDHLELGNDDRDARESAWYLCQKSKDGRLEELFDVPSSLTNDERVRVQREGWVLGV
jgi:hypothetical protein